MFCLLEILIRKKRKHVQIYPRTKTSFLKGKMFAISSYYDGSFGSLVGTAAYFALT